jgi:DNA invertase Pin-like site-specific DNA recombinase
MKVGIYGRVSTIDKGQDPELQLRPLRDFCQARGWEVVGEHVDRCTGTGSKRHHLDILMAEARCRRIDCIVVWKLDRFGRSLKHLVTAIDELSSLGVSFVSYQEQIDLTTPTGKLMFHIIAAMAEFERELIIERVKAGVANARLKGKRIGRKPVAPIEIEKIIEIYKKNPSLSVRKIAGKTNLSIGLVGRVLKEHRETKKV